MLCQSLKEKKLMKTKIAPGSRRKRHLAALADPAAQERLESLQTEWNDLNYVQRGDRLIDLLSAGCTERGLATDLRVDDGTVRRYIEIARLSEPDRTAIEAGGDAKSLLEVARARHRMETARARFEREMNDGGPSDELRNVLAWFLMTEQPGICCWSGNVEQLIRELKADLLERGRGDNKVEVLNYLDPAYPLGSAIKMAKPNPEDNRSEMGTAAMWLLKLILLLESIKQIRDVAVEKLRDPLFRVHLRSGEIRAFAKAHTPASLVAALREQPLQNPLYL
jgi:hypothetical protein